MEIFFYVPVAIIIGVITIPTAFYFISQNKTGNGNKRTT